MNTAHAYYQQNITAQRQLLPLVYIEHMPIKEVTLDEWCELKCNADFNPTRSYGLEETTPSFLLPREVGHDQCYRYVVEKQ